ncbi:MAG: hypothetical protein WC071_05910, partial [Victivallaceae bacterium]
MNEEEYIKYASNYSVSLMNNTKWIKLFMAINNAGIEIQNADFKFIDSDHILKQAFPKNYDLNDNRFNDGRFQPFEYKWIKEIFIPNEFKPIKDCGYTIKQNTKAIISELEKIGKFPIEEKEDG